MSQITADEVAPLSDPAAPDRQEPLPTIPLRLRLVNLTAVTLPFVAFLYAIYHFWGNGIDAVQLSIFAVMYVYTGMGITVGYHRLFTHRSFEAPAFVRYFFGIGGSMAVEGTIRKWVATHRRHHQHSDDDGDPHSPHHHGEDLKGMLHGLYHAHFGWLFQPEAPGLSKYVPDLIKDPVARNCSKYFPHLVILGLVLPAVAAGLITRSWSGFFLGYLWGGLVRIFLVHHVTWSINSVCHIWGARPFRSHDHSRNNVVFGFLAMGEGWHNNHHAFPTSARHGLAWWQFDFSWCVIRTLKALGLAWDVRVPDQARIDAKRADKEPKAA